jgi:hypothetical protein
MVINCTEPSSLKKVFDDFVYDEKVTCASWEVSSVFSGFKIKGKEEGRLT